MVPPPRAIDAVTCHWFFLGPRPTISDLIRGFQLASGIDYQVSERAEARLRNARSRDEGYATAAGASQLTADEVTKRLELAGFARSLTDQQLRNVSKLALLPAGATFFVPGAGKRTLLLALPLAWFLQRTYCNLLFPQRTLVLVDQRAHEICEGRLFLCGEIDFHRHPRQQLKPGQFLQLSLQQFDLAKVVRRRFR